MKRTVSLLLTMVMVLGTLGIVPAAAAEDSGYVSGDIDFFTSFSDYSGTDLPNGFINIEGGVRPGGVNAYTYEDDTRTSTVAVVNGNKEPVLPFGTNFMDGKLHISFDYLQTNGNKDTATDRELALYFAGNGDDSAAYTGAYGDAVTGEGPLTADGSWNINMYDYTKLIAGKTASLMRAGSKEAGTARRFFSQKGDQFGVDIDKNVVDTMATAEDTWYKVDMFFDRDNGTYEVYVDGVAQNSGLSYEGTAVADSQLYIPNASGGSPVFKGLIFRCDHMWKHEGGQLDESRQDGYFYLDNVYVSAYDANHATNDVLKMTADTQNQVMQKGKKLNIAFSEYLATVPTESNIQITKNGKEFTGFTVTADGAQATITFTEELENGVYNVAVTGVQGAISASSVSNTVSFTAAGAGTDAASTDYYWANEDFNEMADGVIPANWYYGEMDLDAMDEYNRYFMGEVSENYATEVGITNGADNTTALEMKSGNSNSMYYFFPRGVASGDFKAEFDIKHTNGGWTFGFVNYDDYNMMYQRNKYGRLKSGTGNASSAAVIEGAMGDGNVEIDTSGRMQSSILMGMAEEGYSTETLADRAFSPNLGMIGNDTKNGNDKIKDVNNLSKLGDMTVTANAWSKIEIDVNDNSKVYTIKVTPYNNDGSLNTGAVKTETWTDTDDNRYFKGIMGLRFTRNAAATGSVAVDNVKVYKTGTAYLDEDFDDYTETEFGTGNKKLPSGWMDITNKTWWEFRYSTSSKASKGVTSSTGRDSTDANDKSMFLYYKYPAVYKSLDKPVPAGEPFIMEFDVYNVGTATTESRENPWVFMQMGKEDTHQLLGYNYEGGVSSTGKVYIAPVRSSGQEDAAGSDANANLAYDSAIASYKPFADKTNEDGTTTTYTVEDTYLRLQGNSMQMNVLFGRPSQDFNLKYTQSGRFDVKRAFHNESVNTDIVDEIGSWINYKVLCEPISATETKYTITQTKADGTQAVKTFTNNRDWVSNDTYAVGFAVPFKNASKHDVSDGTIGTKIDNVKVYAANTDGTEITTVDTNYIASIKASNTSEEKDITGDTTIPVGTTKLDITFSADISEKVAPVLPLANRDLPEVRTGTTEALLAWINETYEGYVGKDADYVDYTSVLDSIKDVISLRKLGSQLESGTISLSADKKTVTITFAEALTENDKYTLGISRNIAFDGNGYATLGDNFTQLYTVSGAFSEPEFNFTKLNVTVLRGSTQIPINKAGILTAGETVTTAIDYANPTTESAEALVFYAFYNTDATTGVSTISGVESETFSMEAGASGRTDVKTFPVPTGYDVFKAFSWSYPDMKPYTEVLEQECK